MTSPQFVLGTAQLTVAYGVGHDGRVPTFDDAVALVRGAVAAGVAALDTAPAYGRAEEAIGAADVPVAVFTKVGAGVDPAESVERSLGRLGRTAVDGLFLHDPSLVEHDPEGVVDRAAALVGVTVGFLGCSVYSPEQAAAVVADERFGAVQVPLSAADRRILDAGVLAAAAARGVRVYARSVFLQGALMDPSSGVAVGSVVAVVDRCAAELGVGRRDVLLAYVRDLPHLSGVVVGVDRGDQLAANVAAHRQAPPLPAEWRAALDALPVLSENVVDPRRWPA